MRLEFTDTIDTIYQKAREHLNVTEAQKFNIIEVKPLQNGFCALLNPLSSFTGTSLAKDCGFTNQSTWIIVLDQPELEDRLV